MTAGLAGDSLAVAAGATVVAWLAGLVVAVAAAVGGRLARAGWLAVAVATLALPPFLPANCWLELTAGWRNAIGAERAAYALLPATALVLGLMLWPLVTGLVLGAWQRLQPAQLEAEPGLTGRALARHLLLPSARGALGQAGVLVFALALANFSVPTLFQVRVFTEEFWVRYNTQLDAAGALAATWPLLLAPGLVWAGFRGRKVAWPRLARPCGPALLAARIGRAGTGAARAAATVVGLLSLGLPLGRLVLEPRTWTELPGAWAAGQGAIGNSLFAAALAATLVVAAGHLAAPRRGRGGRAGPTRGPGAAWMLFLLPGVFTGLLLIGLLNRPGFRWLYAGFGILPLALSIRYLAPAWAGVGRALGAVDRELVDAARLAGASRWTVFRRAYWPQVSRATAAIWYAAFLLGLWDVESVVLIQPPGGETLALRVFNLLHYGHAAQVNALCVVMLGLALLPLTLALGWCARRPRLVA